MFDDRHHGDTDTRARLRALLGDDTAWAAARRSTLNAHYTSASVVQAMWRLVENLGFDGGQVLEPGCGSGHFLGFAPDNVELTGVELDPTSAAIAEHLYGARATIQSGRFEDFTAPDGHFDLVIGNVPFAQVTPHDPHHNRKRHSLHNYFLAKSLALTRPGGLVAALTSRYTLDAHNPTAREDLAELGDLVGALRLPAGTFSASSGTQVVCDLLVLRRRRPGEPRAGPDWMHTVPAPLDAGADAEERPAINEYLAVHPQRILGRLTVARGMYRDEELSVEATGPLDDLLHTGVARLVDDARRAELTYTRRTSHTASERREPAATATVPAGELAGLEEGSFVLTDAGSIARLEAGSPVPYRPRVKKDRGELRRLIHLRDAARTVLAVQVDGGDDAALGAAQGSLRERYDDYRRNHGPLNRYRLVRSGRTDPETGEERHRRMRPRMGGFRDDPHWPLVAALEVFDDTTHTARPAAIFHRRIIDPPQARHRVDSPEEAVAVCLDETGTVTLQRVSELLDVDAEEARRQLTGHVWDDPDTAQLVPAAQYLSGNIRQKLDTARRAAESDERFHDHVAALERVLPHQLEASEIHVQLGAPWIPEADIEAFCTDLLDVEVDVERLAALGRWAVKLRFGRRSSVALSSEWGTARADAVTLLEASLNQRLHTVTDETEDGKRIRNVPETIAAREKQDAIGERFATWLWEDPARAERLADRYNALFNSVVVPTHDGSHLTFPGLTTTFHPHRHQRDAVARILTDGRALLAHAVGAGKTATMVIAAMEMRRLGLATKPAVVVPNHMLEQFTREWLQLYPSARVLLADRQRLSRDRRKEFVARAATGDWDAIVFTQSSFARLPLGSELRAEYLGEQLARARDALAESKNGKGLSVKRLERRIAQLEETYQRLLAEEAKDDGIRFEETGIDYLYVDEAHLYKNRRVDSAIDGIGTPGSKRAQDLDAKLWTLRRRHGPRVATFSTATPVANSMAELWTMQSYLQPDVLDAVDMAPFDAWAANFGRTVTALELAPDGASYRLHTRFARFRNVPELMTMYRQVADVHTQADLDLPIPALTGGQAETVVVPSSERLRTFVAELAERAEAVRSRTVDPAEDNMLKITGEGRRAALDLRLVDQSPDPSGGKLAVAADRIARIHHDTRDRPYCDDHGEPAAHRGALQLVFCDVSTPTGDGWNAYDELRQLLTERAVSRDAVRYIHEASSDDAKAKLFAACRDGRVAVLVGSTDKMGVGTNVQARAIALHHLDCPWRPADIEQREGRLLRQGNQNPQVQVYRYVTEESFDIYMWQTVERKATFIAQITSGKVTDRDIEDIGEQALSYAEVKALATGNPLILEKAEVDAEVAKLTRLQRAHHDDQHRLRRTLKTAQRALTAKKTLIDELTEAINRRRDTRGDRFTMTVEDTRHTKRANAGRHLQNIGTDRLAATPEGQRTDPEAVGELAGFPLTLITTTIIEPEIGIALDGTRIAVTFGADEWCNSDPVGLVQGLERRLRNIEGTLARAEQDAEAARGEIRRARSRFEQPFEHDERLDRLRRRQREINDQLVEADRDNPVASEQRPRRTAPGPTPADRTLDRSRRRRHAL